LWDLRPPARPRAIEALWADLVGDPEAAYAAVWAMADTPATSIPFLRKRLRPVLSVAKEETSKLVADLDSDSFQRREAATQRLHELGVRAEPALRTALDGKLSVEQRRRIEALLGPLEPAARAASPESLRERRAVAVLAWAGTAEARGLLEELAKGMPTAPLTRHARAALGRLGKRADDSR
jgi:hypothetical protein